MLYYIKAKTDNTQGNRKFRFYGGRNETINHINDGAK